MLVSDNSDYVVQIISIGDDVKISNVPIGSDITTDAL